METGEEIFPAIKFVGLKKKKVKPNYAQLPFDKSGMFMGNGRPRCNHLSPYSHVCGQAI